MTEIRIHGRGGQGAVLASLVLARAAARRGSHVQSFPEFGVERRGAPVCAYLRVNESPIFDRSKIYFPDSLLIFDLSMLDTMRPWEGLKPQGLLCLNCPDGQRLPQALVFEAQRLGWTLSTVDGSSIAASHGIGNQSAPIVNTVMAGALVKAAPIADLDQLMEAVEETFPDQAGKNQDAAREGYAQCRIIQQR